MSYGINLILHKTEEKGWYGYDSDTFGDIIHRFTHIKSIYNSINKYTFWQDEENKIWVERYMPEKEKGRPSLPSVFARIPNTIEKFLEDKIIMEE